VRGDIVALVVGTLVILALSCSSPINVEKPPEIRYGEDVCAECHMFISEERFAAAYVLPDGTSRLFDDLGGMLEYDRANDEAVAIYWAHDFHSGEWVKAPEATIVLSDAIVTPMGHGVVAFTAYDEAAQFARLNSGTVFTFLDLQEGTEDSEGSESVAPIPGHDVGDAMPGILVDHSVTGSARN